MFWGGRARGGGWVWWVGGICNLLGVKHCSGKFVWVRGSGSGSGSGTGC